jgi:hypothetical protein
MMRRSLSTALALVLLAACLAIAAKKKDEDANTRNVQGVVSSAQGAPVNGAVVQLKDTKSLQIRSFITREHGAYYFHGLSPDIDYELKAQFNGASSSVKTLSTFDSRKLAIINLTLPK